VVNPHHPEIFFDIFLSGRKAALWRQADHFSHDRAAKPPVFYPLIEALAGADSRALGVGVPHALAPLQGLGSFLRYAN